MPSDAERWRFLSHPRLTLHTYGADYMVHCCRTSGPGQLPTFFPISHGATAAEAVDRVIARYNRAHGLREKLLPRSVSPTRELEVREWVS
jgi:hypothetical protein